MNVVINGIKAEVEAGTTILKAAQKLGVEIPTLCYLEDLPADGSCRICMVEIVGNPRLATACSTPCTEGMQVLTDSPKVFQSRQFVLDLILSTHTKECFSCPKSGICKLQDYCYEYGVENTSYPASAPIKKRKDSSNPFFTYDQRLCIMCRKCARVCSSLQCNGTIAISDRGSDTHMTPVMERDWDKSNCVSCGNCVSNCPTGALMPRAKDRFRYWEVDRTVTTCPYCGVGCQMELLTKKGKVVDVQPVKALPNKGLLCVKGKFAFGFIGHPDRLKTPLIRKDGVLEPASWDEALDLIAGKIREVKQTDGADAIAGFSSARCTNEDNYVFQKFFRAAVGTNNVDHCARL